MTIARPPTLSLASTLLLATLPIAAQAQPARPRPHQTPPTVQIPVKPAPQPQAAPAPPPAPPTPEQAAIAQCRALLQQGIVTAGPATVEALDNGCRYTAVRFGFTPRFGYEAATLTEHGFPSGPPDHPVSVQIEARGITFAPDSSNAKTNYIIRQQQTPFDVTLDASYDPATTEFVLRSLTLDSPALGHTELAYEITGANQRNFPDDVALRSARLHMDSRRLLLAFALGAAVSALPEGDPATEVAQAKAQATTAIRTYLPLTGALPATVDAIAAFVNDFPRPQHVLDLSIAASPPFKLRSVGDTANTNALIATVLHTLTVTATYAGAPQ